MSQIPETDKRFGGIARRLIDVVLLRRDFGRMTRKELGAWGERQAARLLRRSGLRIIARNYTCAFGEIDIIAGDGKTVVFVEVKTRLTTGDRPPEASVNALKRQHIRRVAACYLQSFRQLDDDLECRFDIVAVEPVDGKRAPQPRHLVNAFSWRETTLEEKRFGQSQT